MCLVLTYTQRRPVPQFIPLFVRLVQPMQKLNVYMYTVPVSYIVDMSLWGLSETTEED